MFDVFFFFFFFSSRRRHTRLQGDWSSDVCSSDLGPLTLAKSEHHGQRGVRAGHEVGEREADLRRRFGLAGGEDQAGLALDQQVVRLAVRVGTGLAVAGDAAIDKPLMVSLQVRVAETEALGDTGCEVLEEDVRFRCEPAGDPPALGFAEVQRQIALAGVDPYKARREAADGGVPTPDDVTAAGTFQLD